MFENFPYTNFHDLNLDWLIQKIMEAYGPDNPPPVGLVLSVNGETGAVVLYKDAIVTLPAVDDTGWNIHRLSDGTSTGIQFIKGQPMQRIDGVNRYNVYDEGNPPPSGTVSSVDGMTGVVKTWANTSTPGLNIPDDSSGYYWDLRRGLSNGDTMGISFEYDSVNQVYKTYLVYTPNGGSQTKTELLTSASLPPTGVVSVNGSAGIVVLTGTDIAIESGSQDSVKDVTDGLQTQISGLSGEIIPMETGGLTDIKDYTDTAIAGLYGDNILIESGSNDTIKDYIDNHSGGGSYAPVLVATMTGDGVKTYATLLTGFRTYLANMTESELYKSFIVEGYDIFKPIELVPSIQSYKYARSRIDFSTLTEWTEQIVIDSNCTYQLVSSRQTGQDATNAICGLGRTIKLYK